MGLWSIISAVVPLFITTTIVIAVIILYPNLPPEFEYEAYQLQFGPLTGPLKLNDALNNAERLFEGRVKGPEHLVVHNNELYTSIHGGYVVKIVRDTMEPIVKFGRDCDGYWQEHICGRPLGFAFDKNGTLYAADAYYGIKKFDPKTGTVTTVVDIETEVEGEVPKLPNSLDIASDGKIYWTDSSTTHQLRDGLLISLGHPTGRLIVYDPISKNNKVLLKGIHFANGVQLSPDESFVLVAETMRARILKYQLKGPKAGTSDIFINNLPGLPDNLHYDGKGNFATTLVEPSSQLLAINGQNPLIRKFLARSLSLLQLAVNEINSLYPNYWLERTHHLISHFDMMAPLKALSGERVTAVFFDVNGKVTRSLHATDGNVTEISSIVSFNGYYYLGSPFNDYLARVKITR